MKADFEKGTKVCSKCKRELPIEEFHKDKSKSDGLNCSCKECSSRSNKKYYKDNKEKTKIRCKKWQDKNLNTFGRTGRERGKNGILKRNYELLPEQLERREKGMKRRRNKTGYRRSVNAQGILVWYDGKLNDLTTEQYSRELSREYNLQKRCAVRGYVGIKEPSVHFLFDFDLEQMLKDNAYYRNGKNNKYIEKWWPGTIRHWTVKDGIWRK